MGIFSLNNHDSNLQWVLSYTHVDIIVTTPHLIKEKPTIVREKKRMTKIIHLKKSIKMNNSSIAFEL